MDEDVERVVPLAPAPEDPSDLGVGLDVARFDEGRSDRCREGPDPFLDEALDRREADLGTFRVQGLGDPPRDRVVVGDAEDERRLAVEQSHPVLRTCRRRAAYHRPMTPHRLREALRGVRGFVLDADGVLVLQGRRSRARSSRSLALEARGIPFRVVTNFSQLHRETLAGWFSKGGLTIDPGWIITGTSAAAAHTAATHPGRPLLVLAAPDALREFEGQRLLTADEADAAPPGSVAAVVIGDAGDDLSYRNMDVAFRLIRGGADLLAMHRNPWWLTPKGPTLDAGGVRRRARVRDGAAGTGPRQALAGRLSPGGRRARGRPRGTPPAIELRDGR